MRPGCLVTRAEPGAGETALRIAALGWEPVLAPALIVSASEMAELPPFQAAVVTSAAAAAPLAAAMRDAGMAGRPVLAVGEATAVALRIAGLGNVRSAEGDAASVARHAAGLDPAGGPLLLAMGEGYGEDLAADLRARGFTVVLRTAYAAREAVALPERAREALEGGRVKAALFLSPRGATTCVRLLRGAGLEGRVGMIRALALSPRIGHALSALRWESLDVAARPCLDDLLALLGRPDAGPAVG